jgi:hypothetical protein
MSLIITFKTIEMPLNESQKELLGLNSVAKLKFKSTLPAAIDNKDNIYYLNRESYLLDDIQFYAEKNLIQVTDESDLEIGKNKVTKIFHNPEVLALLIKSHNDAVNSGEYDDQIKQQRKKAVKAKVTTADVVSGTHRASPNNKEKNHNWVPTGETKNINLETVPNFYAYYKGEVLGSAYTNIRNCCLILGGLNTGSVLHCLRGERESAEGYTFAFVEPHSVAVQEWLAEQGIDN